MDSLPSEEEGPEENKRGLSKEWPQGGGSLKSGLRVGPGRGLSKEWAQGGPREGAL